MECLRSFIKEKITLSIVSACFVSNCTLLFRSLHLNSDCVFSVVLHQEDQPEQVINYAASAFMCTQCPEAVRHLSTCLLHFSPAWLDKLWPVTDTGTESRNSLTVFSLIPNYIVYLCKFRWSWLRAVLCHYEVTERQSEMLLFHTQQIFVLQIVL